MFIFDFLLSSTAADLARLNRVLLFSVIAFRESSLGLGVFVCEVVWWQHKFHAINIPLHFRQRYFNHVSTNKEKCRTDVAIYAPLASTLKRGGNVLRNPYTSLKISDVNPAGLSRAIRQLVLQTVWSSSSHFNDLAGVTGRTFSHDVRSMTSLVIQYKC